MSVDRDFAIFGTEETVLTVRRFSVGILSFGLESGGIRHVRYGGHEVMRGIQYLLRDRLWATPAVELDDPELQVSTDSVSIRYRGVVRSGDIHYRLAAAILATADGRLEFKVEGRAVSAFEANRIGFTLLHPTPQCEGIELTIEHGDGSLEETRFPLRISPAQPVFDIRSLRYSPHSTVEVQCALSSTRPGIADEPFEMEDQRNWSDASYKTYVGTLLEPLPFAVKEGDIFRQSVILMCTPSNQHAAVPNQSRQFARLQVGDVAPCKLPELGIALPLGSAAEALAKGKLLAKATPSHLTAYIDGAAEDLGGEFARLRELTGALACTLNVEIELPCVQPPIEELGRVAAAAAKAPCRIAAVLACPKDYLRSYQPTATWPEVPPLAEIYRAAREAFPGARIGGGMLSYFTELNRKWPPADGIDFVSHTLTPIVHAADDLTIMENLATLSAMGATIRHQLGDLEYRLGPSAISMRHNPYGGITLDNPGHQRLAMANSDPRERGVFGAVWLLGLVFQAQQAGVSSLTAFAASGSRSLLWNDPDGAFTVRPVFHVFADLAKMAAHPSLHTTIEGDEDSTLIAVAARTPQGVVAWLGNPTDEPRSVILPGPASIRSLDTATFEAACSDPDWLEQGGKIQKTVELDAYSVTRCHLTG